MNLQSVKSIHTFVKESGLIKTGLALTIVLNFVLFFEGIEKWICRYPATIILIFLGENIPPEYGKVIWGLQSDI